jgi:hypothetical protein
MSDPGAGPDPMDKAYVEAEAALDAAAARAARRARLLAAVAREPAMAPAPVAGRSRWRYGRWLAAACVAGLAVLIAIQTRHPGDDELRVASSATPAPSAAAQPVVAEQAPTAPTTSAMPAPPVATPALPPVAAKAEPPPPAAVFAKAEPPPLPAEPLDRQQAFAQAAAPPPPPPPPSGAVSARREERVPVAVSAFTSQQRSAQPVRSDALANAQSDPAASLRAAAAAGRTDQLEDLLTQGVPVDAADARGETALMKSIKADQPAAAALLRGHGASLDRKDQAGESARAMATAKDDPALNQALGLAP